VVANLGEEENFIIIIIHFEVFPDLSSSNLGPQARSFLEEKVEEGKPWNCDSESSLWPPRFHLVLAPVSRCGGELASVQFVAGFQRGGTPRSGGCAACCRGCL
jgi:hypothetical protein